MRRRLRVVNGEGDDDDAGDEADAGEAEFALAVGDAWQGQGLGRALVRRLATHARATGLAALTGTVMAGNEPMLHLMKTLGAELRGDASEVKVRLPL
jgi:RimJ/RimL family protein N-acetyltransferase